MPGECLQTTAKLQVILLLYLLQVYYKNKAVVVDGIIELADSCQII